MTSTTTTTTTTRNDDTEEGADDEDEGAESCANASREDVIGGEEGWDEVSAWAAGLLGWH